MNKEWKETLAVYKAKLKDSIDGGMKIELGIDAYESNYEYAFVKVTKYPEADKNQADVKITNAIVLNDARSGATFQTEDLHTWTGLAIDFDKYIRENWNNDEHGTNKLNSVIAEFTTELGFNYAE